MAKYEFQTEINKLLKLIVHSLYSNKEIFIRELISNSSDAIDKLRYKTLTDDNYKSMDFNPKITVSLDKENKILSFSDTGIGMDEDELVKNLGTIAKSGTSEFLENLEEKKDSNLIGQFGVGFYSAFMVANKIEVISKSISSDKTFKWTSYGDASFEIIEEDTNFEHGTCVKVFLKEEEHSYTSEYEVERIIKKYSDHISYPIYISFSKEKYGEDNKPTGEMEQVERQSNTASALWMRPKSELKTEDYVNFYKNSFMDYTEPLFYMHNKNEGAIEYTTLFYIPKKSNMDLYSQESKTSVKLYVKRVFITDENKDLLPRWLRFVKGIIDSEDLPLNVSREILQQNLTLQKIKSASVKKILMALKELKKDKERYDIFSNEFNKLIKEGFFDDAASYRDDLLELVRFKSTKEEGFVNLSDYVARMKPEQKSIFYLSANEKNAKSSPLLEKYIQDDIEVLLATDEIDEVTMPTIDKYLDYELKNIAKLGTEKTEDPKTEEQSKEFEHVINKIKNVLGDRVKDVKISSRLVSSPSCIVTDDSDMSFAMQNIMKMMGQDNMPSIKPILEININSKIVKALEKFDDEKVEDLSFILFDQALLAEGIPIASNGEFVKRINKFLELIS